MKFIFEVRLKSGFTEKQYIKAWQNGSEIIQRQPGAQGTRLHRKIGQESTFIAVASWISKEARDNAMAKLEDADERTREILNKHMLYGDITVIGSFEEAEIEVDP